MKTSELVGKPLDYMVAECEYTKYYPHISPSTDWSQGGPIIERENIALRGTWDGETAGWITMKGRVEQTGPTPLIAAMRCYVASKLGDEVDVPTELTVEEIHKTMKYAV